MPRGDSHLANIWTRAQISNSGRGESLCAWCHCRTSGLVLDCLIQTHCMRKIKSVSHWVCCCSITKSRLTLCNPMDCSTPGFPVVHCLLEFAQTHVHWVDNAIQPYHPILPRSPLPSIFPSIRVFTIESALHIRWPKYWSFTISTSSKYSGLISFRTD